MMVVLILSPIPALTIGVPTHNRAWCLLRFIDALRRIDYPKNRIRIVFVDNLSSDSTRSILEDFKEHDAQDYELVLVFSKATNIPEARNLCVDYSVGDYLLFLDSDVIVSEDAIKYMLRIFASKVSISIVAFPYMPERPNFLDGLYMSRQPATAHLRDSVAMGCTMIRRELFIKVGNFLPEYASYEDVEFAMRANKAGYQILQDSTHPVLHITRTPRQRILSEIVSYCLAYYGATKYYFMLIRAHKVRGLIVRAFFYFGLIVSAVIGILTLKYGVFALVPFGCFLIASFLRSVREVRGRWRLVSPILDILFGMVFALGIGKELVRSAFGPRGGHDV